MKLGVRAKLFLASVMLVLSGVIAVGLILEDELRTSRLESIEAELEHLARGVGELIEVGAKTDTVAEIDALCDRVGTATSVRVTIVAPGGRVRGDSQLTPAEVEAIDNHGDRPEVVRAAAEGIGAARRYSTTLGTEMQYVAVTAGASRPGWIIRVARPLRTVDAAIARLRRQIVIAGMIGLLAAALMSALASHWMVRTLRTLSDTATSIARGEPARRMEVASRDEVGHLAGSLNDMAENIEQTVAALADERGRFETVLDAMSDAVIALDRDGNVTLVNSAATEVLHLDAAPQGRPFSELLQVPVLHALLADDVETDTAEFDLPDSNRRVLARVTELRGGGGRVIVLQDVSAIRRLETIRRDFVANVSHELRTPVSVVHANAETLIDGALEDEKHARPLLEAIHRNTERMARLITDLLDLSHLESGRYALERTPVAVERAARRAAEAVERAASVKQTTVSIETPPDVVARADAKALDQVLVNLLENAVKYTGERGAVAVTASAANGRVRIEVADDGPGIPEPDRERVFERFYRIDPGRSRDMGGTGLGLSIVKHLVEAMDGSVGVTAAHPHGSVFWVELPRGA